MTKQDNKTEIESNASSAVNQLPYQMKNIKVITIDPFIRIYEYPTPPSS